MIRVLAGMIAAGICGAEPQPGITRPRSAERVVRAFDFNERASNPFPVPRYWRRAQGAAASAYGGNRPGFPLWNQAVLDYPTPGSPEGAVKLPTNGGSVCLRLEPGVVAVFPDADYRVTARVRTGGLGHARARLVARYLDRANIPIEASETAGALIGDQAEWGTTGVTLSNAHPDAAFVQVDLELLQPAQFGRPELGRHHVWPEDFAGAAWFDDVSIAQLPRIELGTGSETNVVVSPARPAIRAVVRDLSGEPIRARITLVDIDGRAVDHFERAIKPGEPEVLWSPAVERFGWYRATLEVIAPSGRVGGAWADVVWLPERTGAASADRARLGVELDRLEPEWISGTLALLAASRAGSVSVPVWSSASTEASMPDEAARLEPLVEGLRRRGVLLRFALSRVPAPLVSALRIDPDDALSVFAAEPSVWARYLVPLLDKYGQSVQHWRLGVRAPTRAGHPRDSAGKVDAARRFLASLVPGPVVTAPWAAEAGLEAGALAGPGGPDGLGVIVDYTMPDEAVGRLAADWLERQPDGDLHLRLETLPPDSFAWRDAAVDLTRRTVLMWAASSGSGRALPGASIAQPWVWTGEGARARPMPTPLYPVWSNLADRLSGRRFAGEVPLAPGVRCILMAPEAEGSEGTGLLVAWRESAAPDKAEIRAFLGTGRIVAYDPFGNASEVEAAHDGARAHRVPVSDTPVFVEGVDVALARFVASVGLEPGFFSSGGGPHEAEVILSNPFPAPIAGRLHIVEPGGVDGPNPDRSWQISPRRIDFAMGAGQTVRLPIRVAFSAVEEAGLKPFVVDAELDGHDEYGRVRLRTSLEVGLGSLRLDLTYRFAGGPHGSDLIVEAQVGNTGAAPVTLELTAFAPPDAAYARTRASISDLGPGETVVRRFAFPGGAAALRGRAVLVSVQDASANARINRSITIE